MRGDHLPAARPLCENNREPKLRPLFLSLCLWQATADGDGRVTKNAHLDVLCGDRKTVPAASFLRNDVLLDNHSSARRRTHKIIGDETVQGSAIVTFIGVKPGLNCLQNRLLRIIVWCCGLECGLGKCSGCRDEQSND